MSHESAVAWLARHAPDITLIDQAQSTATVAEAAATLGVEPGRIAKTLAFRVGERAMLLVTRGSTMPSARPRWADAPGCWIRTRRWR